MNTPSHNGSVAEQALEAAVLSGLKVSDALFVADAYETLAARQGQAGLADLATEARAAAVELKRGRATDAMAFAYGFQVRWVAPVSRESGPNHLGSATPRTGDTLSPRNCPAPTELDSGTCVASDTACWPGQDELGCEAGSKEFASSIRARRKPAESQRTLVSVG